MLPKAVLYTHMITTLSFKPKLVTKKLISGLPERAQAVVINRYGLGDNEEKMTLEAIGSMYGITRERVRQIENHALGKIRESEAMREEELTLKELEAFVHSLGSVVPEAELLEAFSKKRGHQNHIYLLLVLGDTFVLSKEDKNMTHRWHVDGTVADIVHGALVKLHEMFDEATLISEQEVVKHFKKLLSDAPKHHVDNDETVRRWLSLSKIIGKNPLGDWGLSESSNVRVKGMRDYAYLVLRQHGSPLHFREVTKQIKELFNRKAHIATTHNELIKDGRFVLVGRGLYALKEWGYVEGVVRDVIEHVLRKHGPLTRDEIVEQVLKERYVKSNTVLVNLQDGGYFTRLDDGKYTL